MKRLNKVDKNCTKEWSFVIDIIMAELDTLLQRLQSELAAVDPKAPDVKDKLRVLDGLLSEVESHALSLQTLQTREEVAATKKELANRLERLTQLSK